MYCFQKTLKFFKQQYALQMVTPSPWPLLTSFSLLALFSVVLVHRYVPEDSNSLFKIYFCTFCLFYCLYRWYRDMKTDDCLLKVIAMVCLYVNWLYDVLMFGMLLFKFLLFFILSFMIICFLEEEVLYVIFEVYMKMYTFMLIYGLEMWLTMSELSRLFYPSKKMFFSFYFWLLVFMLFLTFACIMSIFLIMIVKFTYYLKRIKNILKHMNNELQMKMLLFTVIWFIWFYKLNAFVKLVMIHPELSELFYLSKLSNFLILMLLFIILLRLFVEISMSCEKYFKFLTRIYMMLEKSKIKKKSLYLKLEIFVFKFTFWYFVMSQLFLKFFFMFMMYLLKMHIFY